MVRVSRNLVVPAAVRGPMRTSAAALAIVAAITVACGSPTLSPAPTAVPPDVQGVTPVPSDASGLPAAVANRTELPSCGVEQAIRQDGPWNAVARACFWEAYLAGQPAEFASTRLTMEGDPITTIYRVLGDERVELFIDATQDRWGSGTWEHAACTTLVPIVGGMPEPDFGGDESCDFTPLE